MKTKTLPPADWNRAHLTTALKAFQGTSVLVIGDVGLDRYTVGAVERISPEAPVPIVRVTEEQHKLGLAANVADNVAALAGKPRLTGLVGTDRVADDFRAVLTATGIDASDLVVDAKRRTILKERVVSERQQLLRVDYENTTPTDAATEEKLLRKISELLARVDVVILQDYAKGLISERLAAHVFTEAKKSQRLVLVDPHESTPLSRYRGANVLTPNRREAEALAGVRIEDEKTLLNAGEKILGATGGQHVFITLGKDGMAVFSAGALGAMTKIPTYAREVFDVSGAGDTVVSVLALALATKASLEDAAVLANLAAGVEVSKRGTATVTPAEILQAMEQF
ncbi:MAG: D-glycero-beta-D-manno-heptose-7-phosphate kinase [Bacteriovoracia bacterium]